MAKIIAVLSIITDLDLKTENQGDWFEVNPKVWTD